MDQFFVAFSEYLNFKGGRTRQMCDFLAESGYLVILPDFYRGEMRNPFTDTDLLDFCKNVTQWDKLKGMAIPVVEFSREGYKFERFLANNQLQSNEIIEF